MAEINCASSQLPIGVSSCDKIIGLPKSFIFTPSNFSMTLENALLEATWQDAVKASSGGRILWAPNAHSIENLSTDAVYDDTVLSSYKVDDGRYVWQFFMPLNMKQHRALKSYDKSGGRVFVVDRNNQIVGLTTDDTTFKGFSCKVFVEKLRTNDGTVITASPVRIVLLDNNELDSNGRMIDARPFYAGVVPLTPAKVTVEGSPSATAGTIKVINANDGTSITGLVEADFAFLLTNGNDQSSTIDTFTDNDDGTYTIASTGAATGTIDLVAPADLSLDAYQSEGPATYTVA